MTRWFTLAIALSLMLTAKGADAQTPSEAAAIAAALGVREPLCPAACIESVYRARTSR